MKAMKIGYFPIISFLLMCAAVVAGAFLTPKTVAPKAARSISIKSYVPAWVQSTSDTLAQGLWDALNGGQPTVQNEALPNAEIAVVLMNEGEDGAVGCSTSAGELKSLFDGILAKCANHVRELKSLESLRVIRLNKKYVAAKLSGPMLMKLPKKDRRALRTLLALPNRTTVSKELKRALERLAREDHPEASPMIVASRLLKK